MGACQSSNVALQATPSQVVKRPPSHNSLVGSVTQQNHRKGNDLIIFPDKTSFVASLVSPSERTEATVPETPHNGFIPQQDSSPMSIDDAVRATTIATHDQASFEKDQTTLSRHGGRSFIVDTAIDEEDPVESEGEGDNVLLPTIGSSEQDAALNSPSHVEVQSPRLLKAGFDEVHPLSNQPTDTNQPSIRLERLPEAYPHQPSATPARTKQGRTQFQRRLPPSRSSAPLQASHGMKTAVNPQTIANFNRLKTQIQIAEKQEQRRRRKAKHQERVEDVKEYRSLWIEYEGIREQIERTQPTPKFGDMDSASPGDTSLDLKEPTSWYFDFHSLKRKKPHGEGENCSQTGMSLLSESTSAAQCRYYAGKRKDRQNTRAKRHRLSLDPDERSLASARPFSPHGGDYGPIRQVHGTSAGEVSYIDSEASTSRTGTGRHDNAHDQVVCYDDNTSVLSDLDTDNDYNVHRRRAKKQGKAEHSAEKHVGKHQTIGLSSIEFSTTEFQPRLHEDANKSAHAPSSRTIRPSEGSMDANGTRDESVAPFRSRESPSISGVSLPNGFPQYESNAEPQAFSNLSCFEQSIPSVQIDDTHAGIVRWRDFPATNERMQKTARRLDGCFSGHDDEQDSASCKEGSRVHGHSPWEGGSKIDQTAQLFGHLCLQEQEEAPAQASSEAIARNDIETSQRSSQEKLAVDCSSEVVDAAKDDPRIEPPAQNQFAAYMAIKEMSPEHFLLMSHVPTSSSKLPEKNDSNDTTNEADVASSTVNQTYRLSFSEEDEQATPATTGAKPVAFSEESQEQGRPGPASRKNPLKTYDPMIENLSTEAFLRMSSSHSRMGSLQALQGNTPADIESAGSMASRTEVVQKNGDSSACPAGEFRKTEPLDSPWSPASASSEDESDAEETEALADLLSHQVSNLLEKFRNEDN